MRLVEREAFFYYLCTPKLFQELILRDYIVQFLNFKALFEEKRADY